LKLVILDEADAMTNAAQFALRRIIEKFWKSTRFCLICNYVSKIIPALQSRCTRFKFGQIGFESARSRIDFICREESLSLTDTAKEAVYRLSEGDMRRVVNLLQSVSLAHTGKAKLHSIESSEVFTYTGSPPPATIAAFF
jgi:replication factor C subunit 3/5